MKIILAVIILIFLLFIENGKCLRIFSFLLDETKELSSSKEINYLDGKCTIAKCGQSLCSTSPNGNCLDSVCTCNKGYTSMEEDDPVMCCYKQKRLLYAVLLEMLISLGTGHFYRGAYMIGAIKLCVYLLLVASFVVLKFQATRTKEENRGFWFNIARSACLLICSCTFLGWQITDFLIFLLNGYTDKNGVDLY